MMHRLNDQQIRFAYHSKCLRKHHTDSETVVVDELGLQHGRFRADIAVVNGHLAGFEIKSDFDRLIRLHSQVEGYSSVFDRVTLILTDKHAAKATSLIPEWWGLVCVRRGPRGGIHFATTRPCRTNPVVNSICVAQLLWREEAREILLELGVEEHKLRGNRQSLYEQLVGQLSTRQLRERVREKMKSRSDWRRLLRPSQDDDSCPPNAM